MYTAAIKPFGSPITADEVEYTAAPGYPPGTDNVQEALDYLVGATPVIAEMTPTVAGTAYGLQDDAKELNSLGKDINIAVATARATARYQAIVPGTTQAATYADCIFDDNRCLQNGSTALANSIASINSTGISDCLITASTVLANTSTLTTVPVADSITVLNTTNAGGATLLRDSVLALNASSVSGATMDKSVLVTSRFNAPGTDLSGTTIVGDAANLNTITMPQSLFVASSAGQTIDFGGSEAAYIGNQSATETISNRECWISSYDRFFLRTLRNATGTNVAIYDPASAELTYSSLATALPDKQPTTQGGQFGINSTANVSEVNGRNSFNNYAAGPPQLTGVTAVGQQLYQASVPASNGFVNDIFLGSRHQFPGATSIQNSLIATHIVGNATISQITDCNMVVPRASSLTLNYTGQATGASFHSSGSIACISDPLHAAVFSSGGTVDPGTSNLVLCENRPGGLVTMSGSGNTLISSSSAAQTYSWPAGINNSTVIRSGADPVTPSASGQLAVSHTSFRFSNLAAGTSGNSVHLMSFSLANGLVRHVISSDFSRVLRRVGTTNGASQVVFSTGTITPLPDSAISLTVQNASTSVFYGAQVVAIGASSVTAIVFNSVSAVAGSPTMVPSGAGITVHMNMSY